MRHGENGPIRRHNYLNYRIFYRHRIGDSLNEFIQKISDITISDENIARRCHKRLEHYDDSLVYCITEYKYSHFCPPQRDETGRSSRNDTPIPTWTFPIGVCEITHNAQDADINCSRG